jgi:hypothetical protein
MMIISGFIYGNLLHGFLNNVQRLKENGIDEAAHGSIDKPRDRATLNIGS